MTGSEILKDVNETLSCYIFDYKGKPCGIDPINGKYVLWYGDNDFEFPDDDSLLKAAIFDGNTLDEIADKIENYSIG